MKHFLLVGLGGFIGSTARYGVHLLTLKYYPTNTSWGTLIANLIGCLLIGLLAGGLPKNDLNLRLLLMTGICGGFTTFSTFGLDTLKLFKAEMYLQSLGYIVASIFGGIALCFLGFLLTSKTV